MLTPPKEGIPQFELFHEDVFGEWLHDVLVGPASRADAIWSISVSVVTMTTFSEESSGFWRNA
jgi:hypothetical protein